MRPTTLYATYREEGYGVLHAVLPRSECEAIVDTVSRHRAELIAVDIDALVTKSRFLTLNGAELEALVPQTARLARTLGEIASALEGRPLVRLENEAIGQSLNLTPPGGMLGWHYDRNRVSAVVHLNVVTGGELELYPRYRLRLPRGSYGRRRAVQRVLDAALRPAPVRDLLGRKRALPPEAGSVVFMNSRCLHRVAPVTGSVGRVALVFAFDEPGMVFDREHTKDYYGYRDRPPRIYS